MIRRQEAIAATIGLEYPGELKTCRYQPTRTAIPVYAVGNQYWCAAQTNPIGLCGLLWVKAGDQFWAKQANTILWVADA